MKKAMPQEIDVWYILPAIRKELAESLKKQGLNQSEIASKLGITKSAVSQYIANKRACGIKFGPVIKDQINFSAKQITKGSSVMKEIFEIEKLIRRRKVYCSLCIARKDKCNICCSE